MVSRRSANRPKRRTRATIARERGLEPLAQMILAQEITRGSLEEYALPFLNDEVPTVEDAYAGARDIVAETVSEDAEVRRLVREGDLAAAWGLFVVVATPAEGGEPGSAAGDVSRCFRPRDRRAFGRGAAEDARSPASQDSAQKSRFLQRRTASIP